MKSDKPVIVESDITDVMMRNYLQSIYVACDIETTGLDFKKDKICTVQLCSESTNPVIIRFSDNEETPNFLKVIIENEYPRKIFHHAPFDLTFMYAKWGIEGRNIACTKIMSKVLHIGVDLEPDFFSLKKSVESYLERLIDKVERFSDWDLPNLSENQIKYLVEDVIHLIPLYKSMDKKIRQKGIKETLESLFDHIPVHSRLRAMGFDHIYEY